MDDSHQTGDGAAAARGDGVGAIAFNGGGGGGGGGAAGEEEDEGDDPLVIESR
jgi:hypothetical protein